MRISAYRQEMPLVEVQLLHAVAGRQRPLPRHQTTDKMAYIIKQN